jgi:hypothetical protein
MVVFLRGGSNEVRTRGQRNQKGVLAAEHTHRALTALTFPFAFRNLFAVPLDARE